MLGADDIDVVPLVHTGEDDLADRENWLSAHEVYPEVIAENRKMAELNKSVWSPVLPDSSLPAPVASRTPRGQRRAC